jgi:hypothetical protein
MVSSPCRDVRNSTIALYFTTGYIYLHTITGRLSSLRAFNDFAVRNYHPTSCHVIPNINVAGRQDHLHLSTMVARSGGKNFF